MGPFDDRVANIFRKIVLNNCERLCVRESISAGYLSKLKLGKQVVVTLDSAFQSKIDMNYYEKQLDNDDDLNSFLLSYKRVVGITITDLMWHPTLNGKYTEQIKTAFNSVIRLLTDQGIGIVFIPQLFDKTNDSSIMKEYMNKDCYMLADKYDCYFQQYLISKLYAVIGMRYHSNIFSAKMETPFISIAYEQKMKGFMNHIKCENYCIDISQLNEKILKEKILTLNDNYNEYKQFLHDIHERLVNESKQTTQLLVEAIKR